MADQQIKEATVFPTHVGVFLMMLIWLRVRFGLPHARGGVSDDVDMAAGQIRSSPRTWGCFYARSCLGQAPWVFPTHVGVFPGTGQLPP